MSQASRLSDGSVNWRLGSGSRATDRTLKTAATPGDDKLHVNSGQHHEGVVREVAARPSQCKA